MGAGKNEERRTYEKGKKEGRMSRRNEPLGREREVWEGDKSEAKEIRIRVGIKEG